MTYRQTEISLGEGRCDDAKTAFMRYYAGGGLDLPQIATLCYKCYAYTMNRKITQRELRNQSAAVRP